MPQDASFEKMLIRREIYIDLLLNVPCNVTSAKRTSCMILEPSLRTPGMEAIKTRQYHQLFTTCELLQMQQANCCFRCKRLRDCVLEVQLESWELPHQIHAWWATGRWNILSPIKAKLTSSIVRPVRNSSRVSHASQKEQQANPSKEATDV